ncbi:hypothetical protein ACFL0L_01800 [Patescibacteria group bacterium]
MKKRFFSIIIVVTAATLLTVGAVMAASQINTTSTLGGVDGDFFVLDGSWAIDSLRVGAQGVGGVTFFNGTIVNETTTNGVGNPVAFGDNVRIDGTLYRGATEGAGDNYPVKLNDDLKVFGELIVDGDVTIGTGTLDITNTTVSGLASTDLSDTATIPNLDAAETITANWVNTANPWSAAEVADITRRVSIPLASVFTDANGTPAAITAVTEPNLEYTANQGLHLTYSEDDTVDIGAQVNVPSDYASGGVFKALVDTSGDIVTDWNLDFAVTISESQSTPAWDTNVDDEDPVDVPDNAGTPDIMTFTPGDQADLSAGDTMFLSLFPDTNTAVGEPDVEIYALWFEYTAVQ